MKKIILLFLVMSTILTSYSQSDNNCSINIISGYGISVYMDNIFMGKTNKNGIILDNLKAGKHIFSFKKPLHITRNKRIKLKSNKLKKYKLYKLKYRPSKEYNFNIKPLRFLPKDAVISNRYDKPATFPGGEEYMNIFLSRNTKYPISAIQNGIQGQAIIEYIVDIDGSIKNIKSLTKIKKILINAAIRVVRKMPNWVPATLNGTPVRTKHTLPINFSLN